MLPAAVISNQPQQLLQSAFATFPGENGKIAFVSQRNGDFGDIYVMNADGSEQTNISNNPDIDGEPDWSPDGTKITFVRFAIGGNSEIYVMNADGSEQTRLTNNGNSDGSPNWSPDGTKIAFATDRDGDYEIYVMNADGTNPVRLTNNDAADFHPKWSPDGTKIAFATDRDGFNNYEVYVMNADGSEQTRLTNNDQAYDYYPDWSPDGTKIAFASNRDNNGEIYVMNADGTNPVRLTNTEFGGEEPPSWSPDETKIVFGSTRDVRIPDSSSSDTHNWEIYVMNADGSEQTNISNNNAHDFSPDWGSATEPPEEEDISPPVLTVPEDIVANATTANGGTVVTYTVTAEDNIDGTATLEEDGTTITQDNVGGNITISCEPPSSSEFPIGETEVQCTATDAAGNSDTASFIVTVNPPPPADTTPPVITVPEDITAQATTANGGTVVTYTVTAEDNIDGTSTLEMDGSITQDDIGGNIAISCDPPSGTEFPVGETVVECTATDAAGNSDTESFIVTVNPPTQPPPPPPTTPREAIERLISYIENLEDVPENAKTRLTSVLERALALLTDNNARNDASACNMLGSAFINQVNANERRGSVTEDQAADVRTQVEDVRDIMGC